MKYSAAPLNHSEIVNYLKKKSIYDIKNEILLGLTAPSKYISSKYFYDEVGSKLFEQIARLPEYYPTVTEKKILKNLVFQLDFDFSNADIVELGSGDASKISLILKQLPDEVLAKMSYYPVDISSSAIQESMTDLSRAFRLKNMTGLVLDFNTQLHLIPQKSRRLYLFLGSTIGNFDESERHRFLNNLYHEMQPGDHLLLGLDRVKEQSVLENAYNDSEGITARFNKNILRVANRLVDANFRPDDFEHKAFFRSDKNRIEMHLIAKRDRQILLGINYQIKLKQGESIHTENSHKFTENDIENISKSSQLKIKQIFSDDKKWFSIVLFEKASIKP